MSDDPLLREYRIKNLVLKNRIIITAHEPAYVEDGMPKERYRAYHEERARAGVAMTMTAGSAAISRDSPPAFGNILAYRDEVVPWMKALADSCHEHDCAVMIQLTHMGRRTRWDLGDWLPSVSSSNRREPAHRAFPKKAEDWDIERIVGDYADAAERMQAAGLDGIELIAYGHLLDQFLSPRTNDLEPPYGGSLDNRLRLTLDVLGAIRDRVGPDFIVGLRVTADERLPDGIAKSEGFEICRRLDASGLVDFLNIVRGHIDTDAGLTDVIPVQGMPSSPHLDFAGEVKKAISLPVLHAAKINDVATARHAIESGKLDLVGMTRAHLADPHIVSKIRSGKEDTIRPCVGANYCLDRIYQGGAAYCIHNASTGRELTVPHAVAPAPSARKVVVVGAGPAGLEAARVAAERGHEVVVFELAAHAGGQVSLLAQSERRREMISIIDWRLEECERLGVVFHYNTWAEAETIVDEAPEVVVVATGGFPNTEILQTGSELVVSAWDIISGDATPGQQVLLFDEAGDHAGLQAAEIIARSGAKLEYLTPDRTLATEVMSMSMVPFVRAVERHDISFTPNRRLTGVLRSDNRLEATISSDFSDLTTRHHYDQVVVNCGTVPMDELYLELKPLSSNGGAVDYERLLSGKPQDVIRNDGGTFQLFRIGDAVSSRNIHAAVLDANRLVRTL